VSVSVNLPDDIAARARWRADERGVSIDQVVTEAFAVQLADEGDSHDALEAFIACGSSGRHEPFENHAARTELAERKLAQGI
jgi:hypothetical protein